MAKQIINLKAINVVTNVDMNTIFSTVLAVDSNWFICIPRYTLTTYLAVERVVLIQLKDIHINLNKTGFGGLKYFLFHLYLYIYVK